MPNLFDQIIDTAGGILSDAFGWIAPNREELDYLKGGGAANQKKKKVKKKKVKQVARTVPEVLEVQPSAPPLEPLEPIDLTGSGPEYQKKKARRQWHWYEEEAEAQSPSRWATRPSDR